MKYILFCLFTSLPFSVSAQTVLPDSIVMAIDSMYEAMPMDTVIIETAVSIVANLAVTLIGVLGAWLLSRIAKTQQLSTIGTAVGELTAAAEQTVLELQQTVVDGLKAASADGKLTQDEINDLGKKLIDGTMAKMSDTGIGVLKAANVDINAIITGAGEALIAKMKME